MLKAIERIPTTEPHVYAFEISGEISEEGLSDMAGTMRRAFDRHPEVNMLLIFNDYEGSKSGAGMDVDAIEAQWEALSNVKRYAVVGAPGYAQTLINVMDKLISVNAQTFESTEIVEAWAFVGAKPAAS